MSQASGMTPKIAANGSTRDIGRDACAATAVTARDVAAHTMTDATTHSRNHFPREFRNGCSEKSGPNHVAMLRLDCSTANRGGVPNSRDTGFVRRTTLAARADANSPTASASTATG